MCEWLSRLYFSTFNFLEHIPKFFQIAVHEFSYESLNMLCLPQSIFIFLCKLLWINNFRIIWAIWMSKKKFSKCIYFSAQRLKRMFWIWMNQQLKDGNILFNHIRSKYVQKHKAIFWLRFQWLFIPKHWFLHYLQKVMILGEALYKNYENLP